MALDQIALEIVPPDACLDIIRRGLEWPADVNGQLSDLDCKIDIYDIFYLANHWLDSLPIDQDILGPGGQPDGLMDLYDYTEIAANWMDCYDPQNQICADPYDGLKVGSPNGRIEIAFTLGNIFDANDLPYWSVLYDDQTVMDTSQLGYIVDGGSFDRNFRVMDVEHSSHDSIWNPPYGERSIVGRDFP